MDSNALKEWFKDKDNWKKIIIPVLLIAALLVVGRLIDIHQYLQSIQDWIWRLGPWGPVVFGTIYVAAMLLLLPGTPFTIVASLLFGTLWGFVTMLTATTVAAVAGFFIARYMAKASIEKRLAGKKGIETVKEYVEKNLWLAITFVRIMPIFPFAINNYALGLTKVSFWAYLAASEIVFIPMTAVLILGANALYTAMIRGEVSWGLFGGAVAAGLVVLAIGIYGKKTFKKDDS